MTEYLNCPVNIGGSPPYGMSVEICGLIESPLIVTLELGCVWVSTV